MPFASHILALGWIACGVAQDVFLAASTNTLSASISDKVVHRLGFATNGAAIEAAEAWVSAVSWKLNRPVHTTSSHASLSSSAEQPLTFVGLSDGEGGARCMDGSPYGFYIRRAANMSAHASKWLLFLQGGGLCVTLPDCLARARTPFGSSHHWPLSYTDPDNLLSANESFNPFWDFNHVWLPYCSGDTHTGTHTSRNGYGLYFAGALNFEASVRRLTKDFGLGHAERVLLTGGSAGGIGAHNNADRLQEWLPDVQVLAMPIAGMFFPARLELAETQLLRKLHILLPELDINEFLTMALTSLYKSRPSPVCAKHVGAEQAFRCWDASFNYDHVAIPMLIVENMYDQLLIDDIMLCPNCEKRLGEYVSYFGAKMRWTLQQQPRESSRRHSAWVPSCYQHTAGLCMRHAPQVGNTTLAAVASDWFFNDIDSVTIDPCATSNASMPCNSQCTGSCHDM